MSDSGLDYAYLQFIGASPESQKHWQRFYLPYFAGCARVLDVGCGSGDFLEMLAEQGADVRGVDLDPQCCADARARGLSVECADALLYLRSLPDDQFDGIFSAHLVEHLPYETVLDLIREAWRVLRPGGRLIVATPNAQSLFAHLEMYYRHFGHVSFYHAELLRFFLSYAGFVEVEAGANPTMGTGMIWGGRLRQTVRNSFLVDLSLPPLERRMVPPVRPPAPGAPEPATEGTPAAAPDAAAPDAVIPLPQPVTAPILPELPRLRSIDFDRRLPMPGDNAVRRLIRRIKNGLAHWLVLPYLDEIVMQANTRLSEQHAAAQAHSAAVQRAFAEQARALQENLLQVSARAAQQSARAAQQSAHSGRVALEAVQAELKATLAPTHPVNLSLAEANVALYTIYEQLAQIDARLRAAEAGVRLSHESLVDGMEKLDPPWECYVIGRKPAGARAGDGAGTQAPGVRPGDGSGA